MPLVLRVLVTLSLAVAAACGGAEAPTGRAAAPSGWERVPDPPLEPRTGPVTAWTGTEALVLGGDTGPPCPPNADCAGPLEYAKDGAAYDPAAGTWRRLAPAPHGITDHAQRAFVDGVLYVLDVVGRDRLLAYDVAADAWESIDAPGTLDWSGLTAHEGKLVLSWGSDEELTEPDRVYDPATRLWSTLPDDPIGPAFSRAVTSTPYGLLLTAHELVESPGSEEPSLLLAALLDESGTWKRLRDSDQLGGCCLAWSGTRLVDPSLGGADGGEVGNWGRTVPNGGILDPGGWVWSRLPDPPRELGGGWAAFAQAGPLFATSGYVYDDRNESWTYLPRPEGAPEQSGPAVWMDESLLVVGGDEWRGAEGVRSPHAWVYSPRG